MAGAWVLQAQWSGNGGRIAHNLQTALQHRSASKVVTQHLQVAVTVGCGPGCMLQAYCCIAGHQSGKRCAGPWAEVGRYNHNKVGKISVRNRIQSITTQIAELEQALCYIVGTTHKQVQACTSLKRSIIIGLVHELDRTPQR